LRRSPLGRCACVDRALAARTLRSRLTRTKPITTNCLNLFQKLVKYSRNFNSAITQAKFLLMQLKPYLIKN